MPHAIAVARLNATVSFVPSNTGAISISASCGWPSLPPCNLAMFEVLLAAEARSDLATEISGTARDEAMRRADQAGDVPVKVQVGMRASFMTNDGGYTGDGQERGRIVGATR